MRPLPRLSLAAVALVSAFSGLATLAPVGCATTPPCERNSDCVNAYCDKGVCKQDCIDAEQDCPRGYHCNINAQCESDTPTGAGGATSAQSSSATGTGGASTTSASTTGQGGAGTTSSSTTGQGGASTTSASTTSASTTSASTTGAGGAGTTTSSSVTTGAGGGSTGNKLMLDLCTSDAECAGTLLCRPLVRGGAMRCTPACTASSTCPSGTRCETVDGTTYCAGEDTGRPCSVATQCNFGCLTGPQYCSVPCNSGSDCPAGYGCMGIGSPAQKVCVKAEAYCTAGSTGDCIVPAACDESPKMIIGGCTLACNTSADCPRRAAGLASWTCDGLCRRPSGIYGSLPGGYTPAQYHCDAFNNTVNLCNDGLHINFDTFTIPPPPAVNCNSLNTFDGQAGDACVDSCRYQGGCNYGFACVAVGNVSNQRIGLCMPTGFGEVGAACSKNADCVFGYCNNNKCSRDCTLDGICPTGSSCVQAGGPSVEGLPFRRCE